MSAPTGALAAYGALGLPLAFVALPLYVLLPHHYATEFGIPLATLGALLLGARLFDAVADPWIGRLVDDGFGHSLRRIIGMAVAASVMLALGFRALFFPPTADRNDLLMWCGGALAITYLAYSLLTVMHQAWGARLGGDEAGRSSVVSWREGLALVGVLLATTLPALVGLSAMTAVFAATLLFALAALACWAPTPERVATNASAVSTGVPLRNAAFRRLLALHLLNGVASAIPATLVLFFVRDRLQAPAYEPLFLASYFAAGALAMPLWLRAVARWGLATSWLLAMLLAITTFAGALALDAGDVAGFTAVCIASGIALGADLVLPAALLAGVIRQAGHGSRLEGGYFGWWNFATKLNLALAAGLALPLLQHVGYQPGDRGPEAMLALSAAYCLLPCALKALAAIGLYLGWIRDPAMRTQPSS